MSAEELRELTASLLLRIEQQQQAIQWRDLKIGQLTHEMATLKRWTFGKGSEQVTGLQRSLLEEAIEEDLEAIAIELEELRSTPADRPKGTPKRGRRQVRAKSSAFSERGLTRRTGSVGLAARSRFTMARTVFLLSPIRWLMSR
jgi:hypothetical protein